MSGHDWHEGSYPVIIVCSRCGASPNRSISREMAASHFCTASGVKFFPFDPCPNDIILDDVAHALSGINRFAGHNSAVWYSVAEHCIVVSHMVHPSLSRWALCHDMSEGLGLTDMPSPVKRFLPEYKRAEKVMMSAVCKRFGLDQIEPAEVREADARALSAEQLTFQPNVPWLREAIVARKHEPLPDGVRLFGWDPIMAKKKYLDRCWELGIK